MKRASAPSTPRCRAATPSGRGSASTTAGSSSSRSTSPGCDRSGLRLVTSSLRRFDPDTLDPKIHHANLLQSILAKIEANTAGADDALMLDRRGFIAETNATNFFLVAGGVVMTSHAVACPEGITRATVLELCAEHGIPSRVKDLSLTEAYRADEAFCTGTMGELASVTEIDGQTISDGRPSPMTARLSRFYGELTARTGTPI